MYLLIVNFDLSKLMDISREICLTDLDELPCYPSVSTAVDPLVMQTDANLSLKAKQAWWFSGPAWELYKIDPQFLGPFKSPEKGECNSFGFPD